MGEIRTIKSNLTSPFGQIDSPFGHFLTKSSVKKVKTNIHKNLAALIKNCILNQNKVEITILSNFNITNLRLEIELYYRILSYPINNLITLYLIYNDIIYLLEVRGQC